MSKSELLKKLKKLTFGGKGHTPGMGQTLAIGGAGGVANAIAGANSDEEWDNRSLIGKAFRSLIDGATGFGTTVTGADRFGLAGALAGTGVAYGSRRLADEGTKLVKDNVDNPYIRAMADPVSNAVLGSVGGTMFATSLLKGGGLRRLGALGMKKMLSNKLKGDKPEIAMIRDAIDAEINRADIIKKLGPEQQRFIQEAQEKGESILGYKPFVDSVNMEAANLTPGGFSSRSAIADLISNDPTLAKHKDRWLFDKGMRRNPDYIDVYGKDFENTDLYKSLYEQMLKSKGLDAAAVARHQQALNFMQGEALSGAFDQLVGNPGTTAAAIPNMMKALMNESHPYTSLQKKLFKLDTKMPVGVDTDTMSVEQLQQALKSNGLDEFTPDELRYLEPLLKKDLGGIMAKLRDEGGKLTSTMTKLLDNYLGSPATTNLVQRYGSIQNIPAWEYIKAQVKEDAIDGSIAGLAFAPLMYPFYLPAELRAKAERDNEKALYDASMMGRLRNLLGMER